MIYILLNVFSLKEKQKYKGVNSTFYEIFCLISLSRCETFKSASMICKKGIFSSSSHQNQIWSKNWGIYSVRTVIISSFLNFHLFDFLTSNINFKIYWWMNRVGVCEDYAFLLSFVNITTGVECLKRRGICPKYLTNGTIWRNVLT